MAAQSTAFDDSICVAHRPCYEPDMIKASELTARETAALLHFYAEAGIDTLVDDIPSDRLVQLAPQKTATSNETHPAADGQSGKSDAAKTSPQSAPSTISSQTTIPDEKAVSDARFAAESARSLASLKDVLASFSGCNLKHNARSTICLEAMPESGILAVCGFPTGDDDRAGQALSGRAGLLFERMLAAIGLSRDDVGITTAIPWRTPGDRSPTISEADICVPFLTRQIALAEPKALLLMGNFASRLLIDRKKTVFELRGQWQNLQISGQTVPTLVSFSPSELLAAPANKKLAWQDLQSFRRNLD